MKTLNEAVAVEAGVAELETLLGGETDNIIQMMDDIAYRATERGARDLAHRANVASAVLRMTRDRAQELIPTPPKAGELYKLSEAVK